MNNNEIKKKKNRLMAVGGELVVPNSGIGSAVISLVAQLIGLCTPSAGALGLIPGQGTRSHMHAPAKSSHATTKERASRN